MGRNEKPNGAVRTLSPEEQKVAQEMVESLAWDLMVFLTDRLKNQPRTTLVPETPFFHAIVLGALHHAIVMPMPPAGQQAVFAAIPSLTQAIASQALHRRMRARHGLLVTDPEATQPDPYHDCECGSGKKWRFCHGPRGVAHGGEDRADTLAPGMGEVVPEAAVHASEIAADEVIAHAEKRGEEPRAETIAEAIEAAVDRVKE
jgi:hypothetical protein